MPRKKPTPNHGKYYEVKISYKDEMTGQTKRKAFLSTISKADAKKKAEEWKVQRAVSKATGISFDVKERTLEDWANEWLTVYKKNRSASTYNGYAEAIKNEIIPFFKGVMLSDIHPADIQAFYNSLPLRSASWTHKRFLALSGLLKSAVDNGIITKSPHDGITPPKGKPPAPKRTYPQDDRDRLYKAACSDPEGMPIAILLELGLRREELLGLRWEDIDLIHKTVTICRAVKLMPSGGYAIGDTKNKSSRRILPITDEFSAYLSRFQSTGYVVPAPFGGLYNPHNWSKKYFAIMERLCTPLKIPVLNPHELRHTCGTLLYERTGNLFAVSKFLGHASTAITAAVYVHSSAESLRHDIYGRQSAPKTETSLPASKQVKQG